MKYFFLWCMPDHADLRDIEDGELGNGMKASDLDEGQKVAEKIVEPVKIKLEPGTGAMPEMFMDPFVITDELLDAFRDCGVDNIDSYDAIIVDENTGQQWHNYKLCNLIGVVDIFDMDRSELHPDSPPEIAVLFEEIVIDSEKAKGHHMFRSSHMSSHIMVSEHVRDHIESKGVFKNLEFIEPEDYA